MVRHDQAMCRYSKDPSKILRVSETKSGYQTPQKHKNPVEIGGSAALALVKPLLKPDSAIRT